MALPGDRNNPATINSRAISTQKSSLASLQKGKACLTCRKRKTRCDGEKPVCGPCAASDRGRECEYTDIHGRSSTFVLEENIARLEAHIRELENVDGRDASVPLHNPYIPSPERCHLPAAAAQGPRASRLSDSSLTSNYALPHILSILLDNFLPFASDFGFFMHVTNFRNSALQPLPAHPHDRPTQALLNVVCLWGVHLSTPGPIPALESHFLSEALSSVATALSDDHPCKVVHTLQAQVLLCNYFLRQGRFLKAEYHEIAASSLVISAGLYKYPSSSTAGHSTLPTPRNAIEEGERIRGFWTVLVLDNSWSVTLGSPSNISLESEGAPGSQIETPWPLEMDEYEQGRSSTNPPGNRVLDNFLQDLPLENDDGSSTLTMQVKASALFKKATDISSSYKPNMTPQESAALSARIISLDAVINKFRQGLAPLDSTSRPSLVVANSISHIAAIQLHGFLCQRNARSRQICLSAAKSVVDIIECVNMREFKVMNPIMTTVWLATSRIIADEIRVLKAVPNARPLQLQLEAAMERILDIMMIFSERCPLTKFQRAQIQETYAAVSAAN